MVWLWFIVGILLGVAAGISVSIYVNDHMMTVKSVARSVQLYCEDHACEECKLHSMNKPYCRVGYPLAWKLDTDKKEG